MSLRDQLLKSGLASKEQAKKAGKAAKKKQHEQLLAKKKGLPQVEQVDEITREILAKQEEIKERDRELNRQREEQRIIHEKGMRAGELIVSRDLKVSANSGSIFPYYFLVNQKVIHSIPVTDFQQQKLSEGKLGIATLHDDRYYLLNLEDCHEILELKPDYLICLHQEAEAV